VSDDITEEQKARLMKLVDMADKLEAGLKILHALGSFGKWLLTVGVSLTVIYSATHGAHK